MIKFKTFVLVCCYIITLVHTENEGSFNIINHSRSQTSAGKNNIFSLLVSLENELKILNFELHFSHKDTPADLEESSHFENNLQTRFEDSQYLENPYSRFDPHNNVQSEFQDYSPDYEPDNYGEDLNDNDLIGADQPLQIFRASEGEKESGELQGKVDSAKPGGSIEEVIEEPNLDYATPSPSSPGYKQNKFSSSPLMLNGEMKPFNFYNYPDNPLVFIGSYAGRRGDNNTIIIQKVTDESQYDGPLPLVQKFSTKVIHLDEPITDLHVDKDIIIRTVSIYPKKDWCISNEKRIGDCCLNHETCEDKILPREKKYGLRNDIQYTRFHCACEYEFFKCLKLFPTIESNSLGVAYFNILAPKCFAEEHKMKCLNKNKWKKCITYGFDQNSSMRHRWLDTPTFK